LGWAWSGGSNLAPGPLGSVAGDPDRHRGWLLCPSPVPRAGGHRAGGCRPGAEDPPTFASAIRCHQKSTSNVQLGWVVRWALSKPPLAPPPGPPRGSAVCTCRARTSLLLLCTRPARARPSIGGQSPTPAPRQLPWSPPRPGALAGYGYRTRISTCWLTSARAAKSRSRPL
jgi:hypothetical protein